MIRAIIIDDEFAGINSLKLLLEKKHKDVRILATTDSPVKGIELIDDYRPDVVFLDINMPDMDGFEMLKKLNFRYFIVVFTTAHEKFAIPAIKIGAFDYLLKPVDIDELKRCIDGIRKKLKLNHQVVKSAPQKVMELIVKGTIFFIKQSDIIRIEASGSYSVFYLSNDTRHMVSKVLKECELNLDQNTFFRCHNSHIVNLSKVVKFVSNEGYYIEMIDGSKVEISRRNKESFLEKLKNLNV